MQAVLLLYRVLTSGGNVSTLGQAWFQRKKNSLASLPLRQLGINHGYAQSMTGHYTRSGDVSENKQLKYQDEVSERKVKVN